MQTTHLPGRDLVAAVISSIGVRHEGAHDLVATGLYLDLSRVLRNPADDPTMRFRTGLDDDVYAHVLKTPGALALFNRTAVQLRALADEVPVGRLVGSVHVVEQRFDSSSGGARPHPMFTRTDSTAVVVGRSPMTALRWSGQKRWLRAEAAAAGAPWPTAGGCLPFSGCGTTSVELRRPGLRLPQARPVDLPVLRAR
ncbi:hypothetical protein [Streptomyces cinereoruber]|uniref:hypothetical protein n=1 Tax=Streptomyces cinereoruber TaxID=67260 RepID=UPI003651E462